MMFALADCNNFYVSCERVFQPKFNQRPVVVLSNNDGCVISRSNEAKALGIAMGAPFFKIKKFCQQNNVQIFSSNYTLYGDMSQRVMAVLESFCPDIEFYSIDEAFLRFHRIQHDSLLRVAEQMQQTVKQWTGIPISIGLGETKTLAKLASFIAKKCFKQSLFYLSSTQYHEHLLARVPVGELWGVGRQLNKKLQRQGFKTALQLKQAKVAQLRCDYGVVLERTYRELHGQVCLELEEAQPRKNIVCSRSFGSKQKSIEPIAQALALYAARACEKLRAQQGMTQCISIFLTTNVFQPGQVYQNSILCHLPMPTNNTSLITQYAKKGLKKIYRKGFEYQKTGITLLDLMPATMAQGDLFQNAQITQKSSQLMQIVDAINARMGRNTIVTAAQGFVQPTAMRHDYCSNRYTTCWDELAKVV